MTAPAVVAAPERVAAEPVRWSRFTTRCPSCGQVLHLDADEYVAGRLDASGAALWCWTCEHRRDAARPGAA